MTLANQITLGRMALTLFFLAFLLIDQFWTRLLALILFLGAVASDVLDGYVARKTKTTSPFGALADPLADKILIACALIAFVGMKEVKLPAWAVFLIIAREFVIMGLRSLAAAQGRVIAAEKWGKWKMAVQTAFVIFILSWLTFKPFPIGRWPFVLILLVLAATWASGIKYLYDWRSLMKESWKK